MCIYTMEYSSTLKGKNNICWPLNGLTPAWARCSSTPGQCYFKGLGTAHTCLPRPGKGTKGNTPKRKGYSTVFRHANV